MEFDYKELGASLAWNRMQKKLRQIDLESLSEFRLKQSAISAAEHGETRLSVDTLVEYCNALGIRTDTILDPFLTTPQEEECTGAIIDPYVIRIAGIMKDCGPQTKQAIIKVAEILNQVERT